MKKILFLIGALTAAWGGVARAGTVNAVFGDLIMGFRTTGGTGQSINLEIDLGSISDYVNTDGTPKTGVLREITGRLSAADLTSIYGANWSTRTDLFFGIVGTVGRTATGPNGQPIGTCWASRPEDVSGTLSDAWPCKSSSGQKSIAGYIQNIFDTGPGTLNGAASTANSNYAAAIDSSQSLSWTVQDTYLAGVSFRTFNPSVDQACQIPSSGYAVIDLFETKPAVGSVPGTYIGSFGLSPSGRLYFSTDPAAFASPAPNISHSPDNQSASDGGTATFTATATGNPTPTLQWEVSTDSGVTWNPVPASSPYSGTTTGSLQISPATLAMNTYQYRVRASNAAGPDAISSPAVLTVSGTAPGIATQPQSQNANLGGTVTFTVGATGSAPLTYQWYLGSTPVTDSSGHIAGATTSTLTITGVQSGDAGNYTVMVSNSINSITSDVAALGVAAPPVAPVAVAATNIGTANFTANWNAVAGATGYRLDVATDANFTNWVGSDRDLDVGTNLSAAIAGLAENAIYYYRVRAVNAAGASASSNAIMVQTTATTLSITNQPASQNIVFGQPVHFAVTVTSNTPVTFQWYHNNTAMTDPSATTDTLTLAAVQASDAGSYQVIVTNAAGSVPSEVATLTVIVPPETPIATGATAVSTGGFTANWNEASAADSYVLDVSTQSDFSTFLTGFSNQPVGANLSQTIAGLGESTTYYYRVRAVNLAGTSGSSNTITVTTLATAVTITADPADVTVHQTQSATFKVVASSATTVHYQWQHDGVDLTSASATTDTLVLTNVQAADAGHHRAIVTNAAGPVPSAAALLTVLPPPVAPVAGTATAVSTSQFTANWNATNDTTGYRLDVSADSGFGSFLDGYQDFDAGTNLAVQVTGLIPNTAYYYRVRALNAAGSGPSSNVITVTTLPAPPTIVTPPQAAGVHPGETVILTVEVAGTPPFIYQWRKKTGAVFVALTDGGVVAGATTATLTLTGVSVSDGGDYDVVVSNTAGNALSDPATVTVTSQNIAPVFTLQPVSRTVNKGENVTFTVAATGVPTPVITWRHDSNTIPNAIGPSLVLSNVQAADAGRYTAVATNAADSVPSNDAMLAVNLPPAIVTPPQTQAVDVGGSMTFLVVATGTPAPTYQWYKNGNAINGATGSSYAINVAQASDAADYTVVAANIAGSAQSTKATLTVNLPPAIVTPPASLNVNLGASATFTVTASGIPAPTYQWYKNNVAIPGATDATYTIAIVQAGDAGFYSVSAVNRLGTAPSDQAALVVNVAPSIVTAPASQTVDQGASVTFSAAATGFPAPTYQWLKNGVAITGATGSALTLNNVQAADAADYKVVATNVAGFATSQKATLVVNYAPAIVTQPAAATATQGSGASFTVVANGVPLPTYQWRKNGVAIDGATSATLTLPVVQPADAGIYSVVVTNRLGSVPSNDATLTVNYAPEISTQPGSATTTVGNNATFSVVAAAVPAPTYQWQLSLDGGTSWSSVAEATPYNGTTTAALRITAATAAMNGLRYRAVVRNTFGTATSNPAILTVNKPSATVTLSGLSAVYDGTAKAATATTVPAGLSVAVTYNGSATAPTAAGNYAVVATVNDASFAGSATGTLTIAQVTPQVAWATPAAIAYGTALSGVQLNAAANLPGSFAYAPAAGAFPAAGTVQLTATFTPVDTKNYASVTSSQTLVVNKGVLTATADDKTRVYGASNPPLTISYTGWVAGDTLAALTSAPVASTAADGGAAPGTYPIALSGGAAVNYLLTLVSGTLTVTPQDYSGEYFGKLQGGGTWALVVHADRTATYIAYLPDRQSAVVVQLTVDATGAFTVASTEIVAPSATGTQSLARAASVATSEGASAPTATAAGSAFTLSGSIQSGMVSGQLIGLGQSFTGAQDTSPGTTSPSAGFYTAVALQEASGATYAAVGASGHVFVLVVTPAAIDGASGVIDGNGQVNSTTPSGANLTLAIDAAAQTVAVAMTPAGANAVVNFSGAADTAVATGRLVNLSVRSVAGAADQTLIAGFVVGGNGAKPLLLRGVGPGLKNLGVSNCAQDPMIRLYSGGAQPTLLAMNDDWSRPTDLGGTWTNLIPSVTQQVGAFALAGGSLDSALYIPSQLTAGAYTMHVTDQFGHDGVALAEVYDAGPATRAVRLINVSARSQVGTGDNVLIAGFVVQGAPPIKLLIRAIGPTLSSQGVTGVLADPRVDVYRAVNGANTWIGGNDNWGGTVALAAAFTNTGAFTLPTGSKDAALLLTLPSGVYSAIVSGVNNTTGVGMVEVYEVP